jgi:hypothetical protein
MDAAEQAVLEQKERERAARQNLEAALDAMERARELARARRGEDTLTLLLMAVEGVVRMRERLRSARKAVV